MFFGYNVWRSWKSWNFGGCFQIMMNLHMIFPNTTSSESVICESLGLTYLQKKQQKWSKPYQKHVMKIKQQFSSPPSTSHARYIKTMSLNMKQQFPPSTSQGIMWWTLPPRPAGSRIRCPRDYPGSSPAVRSEGSTKSDGSWEISPYEGGY